MNLPRFHSESSANAASISDPSPRSASIGLRLRRGLIWVLIALVWPMWASGEDLTTQNPHKIKAAYLLNFTRYIDWPTNAFASTNSPWQVGVLGGDDALAAALDKIFQGRTEQGRSFEVRAAASLEALPRCQIVYIAIKNPEKRRAALAAFKDKPVLTVGDDTSFLREGGIIRFQTTDRVQMSINLDQARAVELSVQTKMLEVSQSVLEGGEIRKLR